MNEIPPPFEPGKEPVAPPAQVPYQSQPLSKKACAGLGVLIFIVSAALTFVFPLFGLVGFIGAITSLFLPGYRFIFVGYILTLGVLLLCVIIYCANNPLEIR